MKKCSIPNKFKSGKLLFVSFVCILLTWTLMLFAPKIIRTDKLLCYTSFTIVFVAFSLVAVFSKLQLSNIIEKFVVCFAPATFGVYLIHENQFVKNTFISGSFTWIAKSKFYLLPIEVILSAFGIFFICLLIDKVRLFLFKNLGIDNLIARLSQKIDDAIYNKLK